MCGIAGYIGNKVIKKNIIDFCLIKMKNRGPDYQSYNEYKLFDKHICLLHSRLAIIDLDKRSSQPFVENNVTLIFNGEIYNYREIRNNLKNLGHTFKTSSDTEVLLKSYFEFGEKCVNKFEGMWSFLIYDKNKNLIFASRDRFGEKPFYYLERNNSFYFGSETKFIETLMEKSLLVDKKLLEDFLVYGHKQLYKNNSSIFKEIKSLNPGENLKINLSNRQIKCIVEKYWQPKVDINYNFDRNYWVESTKNLLIESLDLRLKSDVPLAFCLSGGIDSGSLVSIASKILNKKINTFSIVDKDPRYNEKKQIDAVIKDTQCQNLQVVLDNTDYFDDLLDLTLYRNSPVATCSYFVHSLLSKEIKKNGFKVCMSGVGADEVFTGYFDHFLYHLLHLKIKNLKNFKNEMKSYNSDIKSMIRNPEIRIANFFKKNFRDHIYLNDKIFASYMINHNPVDFSEFLYTKESELRNRMLNEMFHEVVRVILNEDDSNSMYYSIENRSPFLDTKLFEMSTHIPTEYLIKDGYNKSILRDAMKNILVDDVRLFREKRGFNASITSFIDMTSEKFIEFINRDSEIYEFVNKTNILSLLKKDSYPNSYNKFIFRLISSKMFLDFRD